MGGKGSGRPKESFKEMSEVFEAIYSDIEDIEAILWKRLESAEEKIRLARKDIDAAIKLYKKFNALKSKINYHINKHEKIENIES